MPILKPRGVPWIPVIENNEITVIVLNWNRKEDTLECLASILEQRNVKPKILLIDNASNDDSVKIISARFPQIHLIRNKKNLGYAAGNNVGLNYALSNNSDYIFVLNNDTVLDQGCLYNLLNELHTYPQAAAVAPKSYYYDQPEVIYFAGGYIDNKGNPLHIGVGQKDDPRFNSSFETDWLTGSAILFRTTALKKIGLFAPEFYLLFEDVDWSMRAKKKDYSLRYSPEAKLWHKVSPSFGQSWSPIYLYYYTRNACLWIERNFPISRRLTLQYFAIKRAQSFAALEEKKTHSRQSHKGAIRSGIRDYFLRRFGERTT